MGLNKHEHASRVYGIACYCKSNKLLQYLSKAYHDGHGCIPLSCTAALLVLAGLCDISCMRGIRGVPKEAS